jgi:hypothetical protein
VERSYKRVEDLMPRDDFDGEIAAIITRSEGLFTEELAALMVVDTKGRSEVRIPTLDRARAGNTTVNDLLAILPHTSS